MSYVHPAVVDGYLDGSLRPRRPSGRTDVPPAAEPDPAEERALIALLRREARRDTRRAARTSTQRP